MKSKTTHRFWRLFQRLPKNIQLEARSIYPLWERNPNHPSLHFKCIGKIKNKPVYSVRIGRKWRVLGVRDKKDLITWFWIGSHEQYNNLISQL